ncbi:MAG: DUF1624 domain-containing protein [Cyclobacteriaceae bacterium]
MSSNLNQQSRITSIDLLRGIVMIIMALDHVRDYFHNEAFLYNPLDLTQTSTPIFLTRFITHFCAPVFVFLAGTSAYFVGRKKGVKDLSIWLLKRGIWLVIVEITIIKFGWMFKLDFSLVVLQVIWVLGISMVFLAAFIHIPKKLAIAVCLIFVFSHNAFDEFQPSDSFSTIWAFLHQFKVVSVGEINVFVGYPIIPWIFVMPLGYHFGRFYNSDVSTEIRRKRLRQIGFTTILLFVILRSSNLHGDPVAWSTQESTIFTMLSFINVFKYPPSLLYLLVTIGPAILLLGFSENWNGRISKPIITIGRVPMFYYIIHIYIIHAAAVVAALLTGYSISNMIIDVWITEQPELKGYGFDLWVVYLIWVVLLTVLYPMSKWYENYKRNNRDKWWLSYF